MAVWPYYTAAWERLRRWKLAANPLCEYCAQIGVDTFASVVDHVRPIADGGEPFDSNNLKSSCFHCHNSWKQAVEKAPTPAGKGGADAEGNPSFPGEGW